MNTPTLPADFAATTRRRWLIGSGATLASALGAGTVGNLLLNARPAYAADYKALVCIFLYGGNDGMNMIVPTDTARYDQYATVRKGLAIPKASLVPLGGVNYGLHPAMSALAGAWNAGPRFRDGPHWNVGRRHGYGGPVLARRPGPHPTARRFAFRL